MSTFVLEIGTEELPARFLSNVEKELAERFLCEVVSLIHVHEIFSDALEQGEEEADFDLRFPRGPDVDVRS